MARASPSWSRRSGLIPFLLIILPFPSPLFYLPTPLPPHSSPSLRRRGEGRREGASGRLIGHFWNRCWRRRAKEEGNIIGYEALSIGVTEWLVSEDNTPSTGLILKYPDVLGTRSVIHSFSIILRNYKTKINLEKNEDSEDKPSYTHFGKGFLNWFDLIWGLRLGCRHVLQPSELYPFHPGQTGWEVVSALARIITWNTGLQSEAHNSCDWPFHVANIERQTFGL